MISRRLLSELPDDQVEALIRRALRERASVGAPSPQVWTEIVARCADARSGHPVGIGMRLTSAWTAVMNWVFPLLEKPAIRYEEQRLNFGNMHWTWLNYHPIGVHLAC